eukprot:CAMPEP_0197645090 /NCGR_PEP_ID=MMETSP1338-20131121/17851_1 /TAXON_ID=43686 ORGANISM="Pelagodinium beii, Strain RCC1491" /NCGR_SAMPLE_ID=MMETSP1338 /ASSEMBLY_ACC=CAM_ASM_000754 /LENGTH=1465 /DNA_ID=CAMNT_0043218587 /DNA_START=123 /DNA_END=4516 /DNA_ORIENTATION=+
MRATVLGVKRGASRSSGVPRQSFHVSKGPDGRYSSSEVGLVQEEFVKMLQIAATRDAEETGQARSSFADPSGSSAMMVNVQSDAIPRKPRLDHGYTTSGTQFFSGPPEREVENGKIIIDPASPRKVAWDVVVSGMIIYSVLVVPFRIGFGVEAEGAVKVLDIIMDVFFFIDIILTFLTGYLDEREALETSYKKIAVRYLMTFFVIDVITVLPVEYVMLAVSPDNGAASEVGVLKILRLFRLLKLGRLFRLKRLTALLEEKLNLSLQMMEMLKVMGKVIFLVHLLACFVFAIAHPVCPNGSLGPCERTDDEEWTNWVRMFHIDEFDLWSRYLTTFHLITATLMAVGYGDIYPANSTERLVCILVQLIGAVVFGFILSCITAVIETSNPREVERKKNMGEIKEWVHSRDLPQDLKIRVWTHLQYLAAQKSGIKDEHSMLLQTPSFLRGQLEDVSHAAAVAALQVLFHTDERALIAELALQVAPLQVAYCQCILEVGELSTELFIVRTGRVDAMIVDNRNEFSERQLEMLLKMGMQTSAEQRRISVSTAKSLHADSFDAAAGEVEAADSDGARQDSNEEKTEIRSAKLNKHRGPSTFARLGNLATGANKRASQAGRESLIGGDQDTVLCALYCDTEVFGLFPISPVKFIGGTFNTELFSMNQDLLERALAQYPKKVKEFEALSRRSCSELSAAALSAEWSGRLPQSNQPVQNQRLKGLIVYRSKATDVRELPKEVFEEDGMDELADEIPKIITKSLDENGELIQSGETEEEMRKRWIISATDEKKITWDLFVGALIVYSVIAITYKVSFGSESSQFVVVFDVCVDIFFLIDLVLSFRTAFIDAEGVQNTIPVVIARNYMTGWFAIDFLSTAPIDRIVEAAVGSSGSSRIVKLARFVRLFRLMKLARMLKLFKVLEMAESSVEVSPVVIKLVVLCLNVCFLAHMVACVWHALSTFKIADEDCKSGLIGCEGGQEATSWLALCGSGMDVDEQKYVAALYWVFTTMTTVGYGDIFPMNNLERAFAVCVMIFGATVFGYIVGSVAEMATNGRRDPAMHQIIMLRHYCEEQNLSQNILRSVRQHYEFWYQENSAFDFESELLGKLPPPLRKDVILHIHRHVISGTALFRVPIPHWLQASIVRMLEPQAYAPGELIIHPSEAGLHHDIYFVYEGICEAFIHTAGLPSIMLRPQQTRQINEERTPKRNSQTIMNNDISAGPLEVYGCGTVVGFEQLLGEEAMQAFGCPVESVVRSGLTSVCYLFAMRISVLTDAARSNTHLGNMLREILSSVILAEGKRRMKERHANDNEFSKKIEAAGINMRRTHPTSPVGRGPSNGLRQTAQSEHKSPQVPDGPVSVQSVPGMVEAALESQGGSGPLPAPQTTGFSVWPPNIPNMPSIPVGEPPEAAYGSRPTTPASLAGAKDSRGGSNGDAASRAAANLLGRGFGSKDAPDLQPHVPQIDELGEIGPQVAHT